MPVVRPYNPNARRIAELMQADLAKVGVKAEIKSFEWGEYRKRAQDGEHQMAQLVFEAVAALGAVQAAAGQAGGEDHAVVGQCGGGIPYAATVSRKVASTMGPVTR